MQYLKNIIKITVFIFVILTENVLFAASANPVVRTSESFLSLVSNDMNNVSGGIVGEGDNKKIYYSFIQTKDSYQPFQSAGDLVIYMYDATTGALTGEYNLGPRVVHGPVFSNNAKKMAWIEQVSGKNFMVKLCDVGTGLNEYQWACGANCVLAPQFSLDCKSLAWVSRSFGACYKLNIVDQPVASCQSFVFPIASCRTFVFPKNMIDCVLSPDFNKMVQVYTKTNPEIDGPNFIINLCDKRTHSMKIIDFKANIFCLLDISMDGKYLTYKSDNVTNLYDVNNGKILHSEESVFFSTISPDASLWVCLVDKLAATRFQGNCSIKLFDTNTGAEIAEPYSDRTLSIRPKFSLDGHKLAFLTVLADGYAKIYLYSLESKKIYKTLYYGKIPIFCFDFSEKGDQVIIVTSAGKIMTSSI